MIHESAFIHDKAEVHADCHIGARTKVWQFASVLRGARLGADCTVASGACFDGSVAGDRTILCHNLAAGPGFLLGDDVFVGPNVTLCNDAWPRAHKDGFDVSRFDGEDWAIVVEDGATIGAGSQVLPGVRIGRRAMVAAGSVVTKDVPPGFLWLKTGEVRPFSREPARMRLVREMRAVAA